MSEVKRPTLITFGPQKVSDKKIKGAGRTIRISLVLPESNEDTCPEYNYKEELAVAKKKNGCKNNIEKPEKVALEDGNGFDDMMDDDEDVKRIAREMEAKYGVSGGMKKRKKGRKDDYADIGMGYDESDSFIDNTDGYDEIIPQNVTTVFGGFYINSGHLEFKTDENASSEVSSSSEEDSSPEKANSRKRVLETSDESDEEKETEAKKLKLDGDEQKEMAKKKVFSHDVLKHMKKKQDLKNKSATVRELLKEKRVDLDMTVPQNLNTPEKPPPEKVEDNKKSGKAMWLTAHSDYSDIIESVVKGVNGEKIEDADSTKKLKMPENNSSNKIPPPSSEDDSSRDMKSDDVEIVKLPENLPTDIVEIIDKIKQAAATSVKGKVKFFSGPVNDMLLSLERKCKCLGKQSRMKVYEHLAPFVRCRKETLIRRAKKLVLENELKKIQDLLKRVKNSVDSIMPGILETYQMQKNQLKIYQSWEMYSCPWLSQDNIDGKEKKSIRLPHRKFPWTEDLRKMVKDIVIARKRCFLLEGKQRDSIEARLNEFVKKELQILWPEGWMSMTSLSKVCGLTPDGKSSTSKTNHVEKPKNTSNISLNSSKDITHSFNSSSALSITPVTISAPRSNFSTLDEEMKSKIELNSSVSSVNKTITPLPELEIMKTVVASVGSSNVIQPTVDKEIEVKSENAVEISRAKSVVTHTEVCGTKVGTSELLLKPKDDLVVLESSSSLEQPQNMTVAPSEKPSDNHEKPDKHVNNKDPDHCQIIDLTSAAAAAAAAAELKRKPGPKSKTRYFADSEKPKKPKHKDEMTGSSALDQLIAKSLSDQVPPNYAKDVGVDYSSRRPNTENDDIQMVMEGLKNLQKMSSPVKNTDNSITGSPVSVIAYNKSYSPKTSTSQNMSTSAAPSSTKSEFSKADFGVGFQDAFQKQFLSDFSYFKTGGGQQPSTAQTSTKQSYNTTKYPHISNCGSSRMLPNNKYAQNPSNNFAPQNHSNKINNLTSSVPPQQRGAYSKMLDDMFSNLLSEYGRSNPATHKPKSQQK